MSIQSWSNGFDRKCRKALPFLNPKGFPYIFITGLLLLFIVLPFKLIQFVFWLIGKISTLIFGPIEPSLQKLERKHRFSLGFSNLFLNFIVGGFLFIALYFAPEISGVMSDAKAIDQIRQEHNYSWETYLNHILSAAIVLNPQRPVSDVQRNLACKYAGLSKDKCEALKPIAACESSNIPAKMHFNAGKDKKGKPVSFGTDGGLYQINDKYQKKRFNNPDAPQGEMLDVVTNTKQAGEVLDESGLTAWSCYKKLQEQKVGVLVKKPAPRVAAKTQKVQKPVRLAKD